MSYTNFTKKLKLPQWVGSDRPSFLVDMNEAFLKIDNALISYETGINEIKSKLNLYISTLLDNTKDLNNIEGGNYSLPKNEDYGKQNRPTKDESYLYVYKDATGVWEILIDKNNYIFIRSKVGDSWSIWSRLTSETELKQVVTDTNKEIARINGKLEEFDKYKKDNIFLNVRFTIDEVSTWSGGELLEAWKIKANSYKNLKLKPANFKDTLSDYRCIGVTEAIAVFDKKLTLHGYNLAFKYTQEQPDGNNSYDLTVYNTRNEEIDISDKKNNTIVEAIFVKKDFFNKPHDLTSVNSINE